MRIEHRVREKHFNADGLSKKTEFYGGREKSDQSKPAVAVGFGFPRRDTNDSLKTVPRLDKDGTELPAEEQLNCLEKAEDRAQISILRPGELVEPKNFRVLPQEIEKNEQSPESEEPLAETESAAHVMIIRDLAISFPPVVRDEEVVEEPITPTIKMITPGNPNADEEISKFAKATKLINAATYSLSDLQRAQSTDLGTLALLKLVQSRPREVARAALGS